MVKMDQMNLSKQEKELIKQEIQHKEAELYRMSRTKISVKDFEPLKIIGRGAFGEVRVCKDKKTSLQRTTTYIFMIRLIWIF